MSYHNNQGGGGGFGGGGGRHNNNNNNNSNSNNYRGGGGGGDYRGGGGGYRGGGGGGGGGYRGGGGGGARGGGGRGRGSNRDGGGRGGGNFGIINICREFTMNGTCPHGPSCHFKHVVQLHATVQAATGPTLGADNATNNNRYNNNNNNNYNGSNAKASVSSIAIWEQADNGPFKIFTASHDGFWRLWNTAGGQFTQEFESNMNGKVNQCVVRNHFLFCGFEAVCRFLPNIPVGMVHAWNLQNPAQSPLELHMQPSTTPTPPTPPTIASPSQPPIPTPNANAAAAALPYAHNSIVTAMHMTEDGTSVQIASGSRDGSIRLWVYRDSSFALARSLPGHAREVTGLVLVSAPPLLWSAGMDQCIRIWNTATGECQYCITQDVTTVNNGPSVIGAGHSHAVTSLVPFTTASGTFVLSASLDRTVKIWNVVTGECVASEAHNEGIICMTVAKDGAGNELLLLGTESGSILCRNLQPYPNTPAFQLLFTLSPYHTGVGHDGAVRCLAAGPSATFYSGGADGKMLVLSFSGDLGLN